VGEEYEDFELNYIESFTFKKQTSNDCSAGNFKPKNIRKPKVHFFEFNGDLDLENRVKNVLKENKLGEAIFNQDFFTCLCEMTLQNSFHTNFLIEYYKHCNLDIKAEKILQETEKLYKNNDLKPPNENSKSASDMEYSNKDIEKKSDEVTHITDKSTIIKNVVEDLKILATNIVTDQRNNVSSNIVQDDENNNRLDTVQSINYDFNMEQRSNQFTEGNV